MQNNEPTPPSWRRRLASPDDLGRLGRAGMLLAGLALFIFVMLALYPLFGLSVTLLSALPVVLASWLFGLRWGVLLTIFLVIPVYNLLINRALGHPWYAFWRSDTFPALLALILIAIIAGLLRRSWDGARQIAIEREQAQTDLRESELRLRMLIEQLPAIIWTTDDQLIIQTIGGAGLREFTALPDNLTGLSLTSFLDTEADATIAIAQARRVLAGETVSYELGWSNRHLQVHLEPLHNPAGAIVGTLGLALDVTQQKHSERALRQAQKLESLGVLAGGIAHDFNNLLVAMLGQTSLALAALPAGDPAREHVAKAVQAAEQAADLTRQMLVFAGRQHYQLQPIDLNALIQANLHLFRVVIPEGIVFETMLAPDLPLIEADTAQLQQVVVNLLLNAAEAHPAGIGAITLMTRIRRLPDPTDAQLLYASGPLPPGSYVELCVGDTGVGISADIAHQIFDPFYTSKEKGHGLGLAVVQGVVQQLNGCIRLASSPGLGTRFELLFPVKRLPENPAPKNPAEHSPISPANPIDPLVLIIDDDPGVRLTLTDILELGAIRAISAADGLAGLALFQQHQADIGLVLLDLSMPGMSGEDTLRALRRIDPAVRVAITSGYDRSDSSRRPEGRWDSEAGVVGFLQKPYSADALLSFVRRTLAAGA